jgi:osmotically-inducible protein OsmY
VASREQPDGTPANDALLVQIVRGTLGHHPRLRGGPRINVSSCFFVVTLHGLASSAEQRHEIEAAVRAVPGVQGVVNRLEVI